MLKRTFKNTQSTKAWLDPHMGLILPSPPTQPLFSTKYQPVAIRTELQILVRYMAPPVISDEQHRKV
jgi:hypothetical protein